MISIERGASKKEGPQSARACAFERNAQGWAGSIAGRTRAGRTLDDVAERPQIRRAVLWLDLGGGMWIEQSRPEGGASALIKWQPSRGSRARLERKRFLLVRKPRGGAAKCAALRSPAHSPDLRYMPCSPAFGLLLPDLEKTSAALMLSLVRLFKVRQQESKAGEQGMYRKSDLRRNASHSQIYVT